jgi:hypothetical protein
MVSVLFHNLLMGFYTLLNTRRGSGHNWAELMGREPATLSDSFLVDPRFCLE